MSTKVQLTGGHFQDSLGNLLVNGYLEMVLSQDGKITGVGQIASGITIKIQLNGTGDVLASPAQSVWGNDQMSPANSYYRVTGYTANGQAAWGPNNQQVIGSGGTFDVGTWIPNQVFSWTPPLQPLLLETNGTPNSSQTVLNLKGGSGTTISESAGDVTISASGVTLKTDGVNNASQSILDLISGDNVVVTDNGGGGVNISSRPFPVLDENSNPISSGEICIVGNPPLIPSSEGGNMANVTWGPVPAVSSIQGVPVAATSPVDQQVLKYISSLSEWVPEYTSGPYFSIQPSGVTTSWVMQGMYAGVSIFNTGGTNVVATASLPPGLNFSTSASAGTSAGWSVGSAASVGGAPIQFWREIQWTVALSQTANMRIWMGMGDAALSNSTGVSLRADTPTMNFVGFRYSTAAGDTKYQCCTFSGASHTVSPESTASHVDTSSHKFAIRWNDTSVVFLIDNVQVGSIAITVPTTSMFPNFYIDNVSLANARAFSFYNLFGVGKTY